MVMATVTLKSGEVRVVYAQDMTTLYAQIGTWNMQSCAVSPCRAKDMRQGRCASVATFAE